MGADNWLSASSDAHTHTHTHKRTREKERCIPIKRQWLTCDCTVFASILHLISKAHPVPAKKRKCGRHILWDTRDHLWVATLCGPTEENAPLKSPFVMTALYPLSVFISISWLTLLQVPANWLPRVSGYTASRKTQCETTDFGLRMWTTDRKHSVQFSFKLQSSFSVLHVREEEDQKILFFSVLRFPRSPHRASAEQSTRWTCEALASRVQCIEQDCTPLSIKTDGWFLSKRP